MTIHHCATLKQGISPIKCNCHKKCLDTAWFGLVGFRHMQSTNDDIRHWNQVRHLAYNSFKCTCSLISTFSIFKLQYKILDCKHFCCCFTLFLSLSLSPLCTLVCNQIAVFLHWQRRRNKNEQVTWQSIKARNVNRHWEMLHIKHLNSVLFAVIHHPQRLHTIMLNYTLDRSSCKSGISYSRSRKSSCLCRHSSIPQSQHPSITKFSHLMHPTCIIRRSN